MIDTVRRHWFDVFGMSASRDTHVDQIASDIKAVRGASRNPDIFVLVGGRLFDERPELVSAVDANATAGSGGEALLIANQALLVEGNGVGRLASGS
jgi:methanogenic corrinoid protein MtbC1